MQKILFFLQKAINAIMLKIMMIIMSRIGNKNRIRIKIRTNEK